MLKLWPNRIAIILIITLDLILVAGCIYSKLTNTLNIIPSLTFILLIRHSIGFMNPPGEGLE
jgi:hypothetical protein